MSLRKLLPTRFLLAAAMIASLAAFASADSIYSVSLQLSQSNAVIENLATNTPLNHGSVTGTFTANLPISGTVNISTFDFNVYDSSNNLLDSFSNTSANATGIASVFSSNSNCCDTFNFGIDGVVSLELYAPLNFTGGDLIASLNTVHNGDNVNVGTSVFLADSAGNDVAGITSGTVGSPVPEPATWALLATGLLAGLWLERKRVSA